MNDNKSIRRTNASFMLGLANVLADIAVLNISEKIKKKWGIFLDTIENHCTLQSVETVWECRQTVDRALWSYAPCNPAVFFRNVLDNQIDFL